MEKLFLGNRSVSCHLRTMSEDDVTQVTDIDQEVFPTMRPSINYHNELQNRLAHYVVACSEERVVDEAEIRSVKGGSGAGVWSQIGRWLGYNSSPGKKAPTLKHYIFGFAGLWMMADEAHIINIAVRENYRRQGLGELLLISMIDLSLEMKARYILLEVRVSNIVAQGLYAKYGFKGIGWRKGYYTDNKEDAMVMSAGDITIDSFRDNLERLRQIHSRKWGIDYNQISR